MKTKQLGPGIAIGSSMLSGVLLGVLVAAKFLPNRPDCVSWLGVEALYLLGVSGAGVIALFVLGLALFKLSADRQTQLDRDLLDAFLEHIPENVFFKDRDSRFLRISRAMAEYCGLSDPSQAAMKTDSDIFSGEHADKAFADEQEIIRTGRPIIGKEEKETWPDGHESWVLTSKLALKDKRGAIVGTMGISHDITERKLAESRAHYLALHDQLTGLANRALLEDRLSQSISLASRSHNMVAAMVIDLDRFKNVNDSYGHAMGDRLLEAVSSRLLTCLRESDTVARIGGDEFVVAIPIAGGVEAIELVAQKILDAIARPFEIEGTELQITASIGIARFPGDGAHPEMLLQSADAAMYEAKKKGRGTYCFFSPSYTEASCRQHKLDLELYRACAQDEFVLHYQPFVSAKTGMITGLEALLRWRHPEQGLIPPSMFIPQLEELGLMVEVGRWALRAACRQSKAWQLDGIPPLRIAVNVSSQQLYQGNLAAAVEAALHETGLDPRLLELELTESRILDGSEATIGIMHHLKRLGVSLSLDDFGTGWSSLSYLRRFPIDRIKIDQSFVRDIATQPAATAVIGSILSLGRSLGIACIAEGVETREQRDQLRKMMCPELQGFLFSQALPAADCTALLRSSSSRAGFEYFPKERPLSVAS